MDGVLPRVVVSLFGWPGILLWLQELEALCYSLMGMVYVSICSFKQDLKTNIISIHTYRTLFY